MSKFKKQRKNEDTSSNVEEINRDSFTPGWTKSLSQQEGLPIKRGGKIVRVTKDNTKSKSNSDDEDENTDDEESDDDDDDETGEVKTKPIVNDSEFVIDTAVDIETENLDKEREIKIKQSSTMKFNAKSSQSLRGIQQKLADICTAITVNPERSLKRKVEVTEGGERIYRFVDLFEMLNSNDVQIFEMAMLSALLVFKDICPGYRIRPQAESDTGVTLKKETRALRDFELALLAAYKKYLVILDEKVQLGLGNARKDTSDWGVVQKLGLSALRCMCELVRSLSHFNFKSLLLATLVTRGAQPCPEVSALCCETITHVLVGDSQGETSYEIVRLIAKVLVTNKFSVPHLIVRCLEKVKMAVHADDSKNVHRRAKRERRKRKKTGGDEVELGLLESKATNDDSAKKRFQADALTEVQLIYFRIIKTKIGFNLLPVALEGLGGITHLINMETVEDLIALMRGILEGSPPAPELVQLLCIHCALRTLSGPGQELKIDEEIYLTKLRGLIRELPADFARWDLVLECLDLSFLKKREERNHVVMSFTKLLLLVAVHMTLSGANALLAMAHAILLRYPRARQSLAALITPASSLGNFAPDEEEKVCDLAMTALRSGNDSNDSGWGDAPGDLDGDGSWVLSLVRLHMDGRYRHIVAALTSKDLLPLPLRISDARYDPITRVADRLQAVFTSLPDNLRALNSSRKHALADATPGSSSSSGTSHTYTKQPTIKTKRGFASKKDKLLAAGGIPKQAVQHSSGEGDSRSTVGGGYNKGTPSKSNSGGKSNNASGKKTSVAPVTVSAPPPAAAALGKNGKPKFGKNRK
jgi:hypothetical protein